MESMVLGRPTSRHETFPEDFITLAEGSPHFFLVAIPRFRAPTLGAGPRGPEASRGVPEASDRPRGPEASPWQKRSAEVTAEAPGGHPFWRREGPASAQRDCQRGIPSGNRAAQRLRSAIARGDSLLGAGKRAETEKGCSSS